MKVTGPKIDIWLVKMVGLITVAIAVTLFSSYNKSGNTIKTLSISTALAYLSIDLYYYFAGILSPVYIGDAVIEIMIIIGVLISKKNHLA